MKKKMIAKYFVTACLAIFAVFGAACVTGPSRADIIAAESVNEIARLEDKFTWLFANAESGGSYVLNVNTNTRIVGSLRQMNLSFVYNLTFKDKSDITITLKGIGENRIIFNGQQCGMFQIGSGVTLILDNIFLQGVPEGLTRHKLNSVVVVGSGGTLIMNEDSGIVGNMSFQDGGGVHVSNGGTFLMNGGLITGNTCFQPEDVALVMATGGTANAFAETPRRGGGVFVAVGGTFTKTGGTITGFSNSPNAGNITKSFNGLRVTNNNGHAVFAALGNQSGSGLSVRVTETGSKRKETTAGPNVNLHIDGNGTYSGNWDF